VLVAQRRQALSSPGRTREIIAPAGGERQLTSRSGLGEDRLE
jgi:hypothetical protein